MNLKNNISAVLSQADYDAVMAAIKLIQDKLPFLIALSEDEKKALPKMADKTVAFVSKALEYAKTNPLLIPTFLDLSEFEKDMELAAKLDNIYRSLNMLQGTIEDTQTLSSSEGYQAALMIYQSSKMAAKMNMPGAKEVYEDLQVRFPGKKGS